MTDLKTDKFKDVNIGQGERLKNPCLYDVINRDSGIKAGTYNAEEIKKIGFYSDHYLFLRVS